MLSNGVLCTVHTFVRRNFPRSFYQKQKRSRLRMSLCDDITRYAMQEEKKERKDKNGINCATRNLRSIAGKFDTNIPIDISQSGT